MFPSLGNAFEAFGFKSGISAKEVESHIRNTALGDIQWMGESPNQSLIVTKSDNFFIAISFCNNSLYKVGQSFPLIFERMANTIDDAIKKFGQPMHVSASGKMLTTGYEPIAMEWLLNEKEILSIMQLEKEYYIFYQTVNSCLKVPQ
jgi:hypothetical protein